MFAVIGLVIGTPLYLYVGIKVVQLVWEILSPDLD